MKFDLDNLAENANMLTKELNAEFIELMEEGKSLCDKFGESNLRDQYNVSCKKVEDNYNEVFVPMLAKHIEVLEEQIPELTAKLAAYQAKEVKAQEVNHTVKEVEDVPVSVL